MKVPQLINIDTTDRVDQVVEVTLDNNVYLLRLRYTDRSNWQLGIYDPSLYSREEGDNTDAKLYGERRLMSGQDFLRFSHKVDTLPKGELYLYDTDEPLLKDLVPPDRYNLGQGKQFLLAYFTEDEILQGGT